MDQESVDRLEARLNRHYVPHAAAIAVKGFRVIETLTALLQMLVTPIQEE